MNAVSSPYVDDCGKPLLRQSVTGFLDVLGFSHLSTTASSPVESQHLLDKIATAISDSRAFVRAAFSHHSIATQGGWAVKFFSDNLVVGFPADSDAVTPEVAALFVVHCAQGYQLHMALNGFFVRGALTLGQICLTDEIIFGPALIQCYRLESKASIVPRVLLTEPLQRLVAQSNLAQSPSAGDAICRDIDGWWFVNYLEGARTPTGMDWRLIERHKQSVLTSLSTMTQHDVLPKFGWACRYHNVFCHWHRDVEGYSEGYRIDRLDEQSTIHRLSDLGQTT